MRKILAIAAKEIYIVFRDRNLVLLMFATPLVLSTIVGLAFGGSGDSDVPDFADIPVAVVNHDEGVDLQETINLPDQFANLDALPFDLEDLGLPSDQFGVGQNPLLQNGSELYFGDILAGILLSQPITVTNTLGGTGFDVAEFECTLLDPSQEAGVAGFAAGGSLTICLMQPRFKMQNKRAPQSTAAISQPRSSYPRASAGAWSPNFPLMRAADSAPNPLTKPVPSKCMPTMGARSLPASSTASWRES